MRLTPCWEARPGTSGLEKVAPDVVQKFCDQPEVSENEAHDHTWHHQRWLHAGDELYVSNSPVPTISSVKPCASSLAETDYFIPSCRCVLSHCNFHVGRTKEDPWPCFALSVGSA